VTALQKAFVLARMRYDNGVSSLLDVLDAARGLLNAQLDQVEAQQAQLTATADLFKALGGGWEANPPSGEKSETEKVSYTERLNEDDQEPKK
jgi:multidrug efflux system outer membrane protein